jgi:hypothetical protein
MYLAKRQQGTTIRYQVCRSRPVDGQGFASSLIYELGANPSDHFQVVEEVVILYCPELLRAVEEHQASEAELDELLGSFFPEETRRRLAQGPKRRQLFGGPLSPGERQEISAQIHLFDRRRLYYLRYGAVDQSRLTRLHEKCCRPLLGQSRDEREFYFAAEEACLAPGHYLQYVYAIFNIQQHFSESFAPWFPEALARDEMADYLLEELCRLHADNRFWQGEDPGGSLHAHLVRYLIMFTDYRPASRSFAADYSQAFRARHRNFRWPAKNTGYTPEKAATLFALSSAELLKMNREELTRLYRRKAMELHPDRGGDHQQFIDLTEIYQGLLRSRGTGRG